MKHIAQNESASPKKWEVAPGICEKRNQLHAIEPPNPNHAIVWPPVADSREFKIYDGDVHENVTSKYNFALSQVFRAIILSRLRRTMWAKYPRNNLSTSGFQVK